MASASGFPPDLRRSLECAVFVGVWMACGWMLPVDPNTYLLLGVPLVVLFQLVVRRRPLRELWVRNAARFVLRWPAQPIAAGLAALPAYELGSSLQAGRHGSTEVWLLCCIAGAVLAGVAVREQRVEALKQALPAFAAALVLGCAVVAFSAMEAGQSPALAPAKLKFLATQFLFYFPVSFVLEEVAFRGALDAHAAEFGATGTRAWISAIVVSVLWGLWHLPLAPANEPLASAAVTAVVVHTLVGVPLSFCWRRGGTLALPAAAHALIDAYRNTVL